MSEWHRLLLVSVACALVAAANSAEPLKPPPLAGSFWELVSVQSMDDAIGTTVVEDPSLYTLELGADGRAALRLNCNRGTASWEASVSANGTSGSIRFGPLAATRALCPPPSLDEQLARDLDYVRGFLLRDGQLHLSLMADGGIYSWRPAGLAQNTPRDAVLGQAVRRALGADYEAHYFFAKVDLDGDDRLESVVLVAGPMVCGTGGCTLMVFTPGDEGPRLVSTISVVRAPVRVSQQRSHGWRNLLVRVSGGGIVAHDAELRFDGAGYPTNPTVPPAVPVPDGGQGEILIPEFGSFRDGTPVPVAPADYGNADDPVAGTVLGASIRTRDAEEMRYVVLQRLTDRYARQHGIEATPAEIDAHIARVAAAMTEDRSHYQARRAELEDRLADGALPPEDRAALGAELAQVESHLATLDSLRAEAAKDPAQDRADRETVAAAFVRQWKINRALHVEFGGRIAFQQGGPEPVDAYRIFLEQALKRGDFAIADPALEREFWRYYRDDSIHSFYARGSAEEARAFAAPRAAATP